MISRSNSASRSKASIQFWTVRNGQPECLSWLPPPNAKQRALQQSMALRWRSIVRQPERWSGSVEARKAIEELARETLEDLGLASDLPERLQAADLIASIHSDVPACRFIEVQVPWTSEPKNWELRIMPWEHLLSAATRSTRDNDPIVVVRHLALRRAIRSRHPLGSGCFVATPAPNGTRRAQQKSIQNAMSQLCKLEVKSNAAPDELRQWIAKLSPSWLHVSGFLNGRWIDEDSVEDHPKHGLAFHSPGGGFEVPYPSVAAQILGPKARAIHLACLELWNSASRIAPALIVAGAEAVIGFEQSFAPSLSELFFLRLYDALHDRPDQLLDAFIQSLHALKPQGGRMRGCGLVLWSNRSLMRDHLVSLSESTSERLRGRSSKGAQGPETCFVNQSPKPWISVEVEPEPIFNYALMHNLFSPFRRFSIRMSNESNAPFYELENIEVTVNLDVGQRHLPFRTMISLSRAQPIAELVGGGLTSSAQNRPSLHIPLLSEKLRCLRERVQSSLLVEVRWREHLIHAQSYPVQLCPMNEWRFHPNEMSVLPSFVLPTDPQVAKVIDRAQPYLAALQDTIGAAFDGTQNVGSAGNPDRWRNIDLQVRAIWYALTIPRQLHYINPPPSYGEFIQRLRTPSEIMEQGRGTCIDFALMMAACMEWIDIPSLIFLTDDHAFPGYWRDLDAMLEFVQPNRFDSERVDREFVDHSDQKFAILSARAQDDPTLERFRRLSRSNHHDEVVSVPWNFDRSHYREIRRLVERGQVIPIETTALARRGSFRDAIDEATNFFQSKSPRSFAAMIDISRSRSMVTPLPLIDQRTIPLMGDS